MKWLLFQQFCNKVFKTILKNEREKHNFLLDDVFPEYWFLSNFFKTCVWSTVRFLNWKSWFLKFTHFVVSSNWYRWDGPFSTRKRDFLHFFFKQGPFPRTKIDGTVHSRRENLTFYTFSWKFFNRKSWFLKFSDFVVSSNWYRWDGPFSTRKRDFSHFFFK